ncbi:transcription factor TFIID complex subunit Taf5-like isoform B [Micractinium conductrix]|uniref:Transcription factor TFIID complex subunit Taf5-like isoform B n=1 Tax=Micractinium conductrix TaxID=554055 RepID=A0A2P6V0K8_9CHLO|nr:transcription factor TFIID complex subunit Taf5-like isoform B [Micractinium conductrix]|eukprot:PSC67584.1 transcription factor TFIID complex subunit Taf5-like isoform B [Micractinium conductrix]
MRVMADAVPDEPRPPLTASDAAYAPSLSGLEPDTFALVCAHLRHREVAALAGTCADVRRSVLSNDRLWAGLYRRQFPQPWERLKQPHAAGAAARECEHQPSGRGVRPEAWHDIFTRTHSACQQLRSSGPVCREWTTDASAVHLAAIHGSGKQRLTLAAQGSTVELRCAAPAAKSFQLYGHTARLSCAKVLRPGGSGAAVQRLGVVTASHDQTVRLWSGNADPDSYDFQAQPLSLLTPLRTLRGHQESVTCLQLVVGSMGVTIAATGSKDRVVRLWGLAPLMPSPVHKPQIATLRRCSRTRGSSSGGSGGSRPPAERLRLTEGHIRPTIATTGPGSLAVATQAAVQASQLLTR